MITLWAELYGAIRLYFDLRHFAHFHCVAGHSCLMEFDRFYRIAFEGGGGQDFGLASAIATLIFLVVGALALLNLRVSKNQQL